jgi:hypothetical protein
VKFSDIEWNVSQDISSAISKSLPKVVRGELLKTGNCTHLKVQRRIPRPISKTAIKFGKTCMAQLPGSVIAAAILGGIIGNSRKNFNVGDCSNAVHF